jgi:hypothetical protein
MGVSKKRREWGYKIFEKVIAKSSKFDKQWKSTYPRCTMILSRNELRDPNSNIRLLNI